MLGSREEGTHPHTHCWDTFFQSSEWSTRCSLGTQCTYWSQQLPPEKIGSKTSRGGWGGRSREPFASPRCCKQTSSLSQLSKWVTRGLCLHRIYWKIWVWAELPGEKLRSGEFLKFRHIPLYTVGARPQPSVLSDQCPEWRMLSLSSSVHQVVPDQLMLDGLVISRCARDKPK